MPIFYFPLKNAIDTHKITIQKSGGGTLEILDIHRLESILDAYTK